MRLVDLPWVTCLGCVSGQVDPAPKQKRGRTIRDSPVGFPDSVGPTNRSRSRLRQFPLGMLKDGLAEPLLRQSLDRHGAAQMVALD